MAIVNMKGSGSYSDVEEEVEVRLMRKRIKNNLKVNGYEPTDENIRRAVDRITEEIRMIEEDVIANMDDIKEGRIV